MTHARLLALTYFQSQSRAKMDTPGLVPFKISEYYLFPNLCFSVLTGSFLCNRHVPQAVFYVKKVVKVEVTSIQMVLLPTELLYDQHESQPT